MSVYTEISALQLAPVLACYGLGRLDDLQPIQGGIENSNYFLTVADSPQLVLTLFEELDSDQAAFLPPLLHRLAASGVPVAAPLVTLDGRYQPVFFGKPLQLAPRLTGQHLTEPGVAACRAMGEALARLHVAMQGAPLDRVNAHGAAWWNGVASRWMTRLSNDDQSLLRRCLTAYHETLNRYPILPQGLIHGDLFRDNCLFVGDAVSGVLDFSEAASDYLLLDMAITVNDFCRDWPGIALDPARVERFLEGYDSVRLLQSDERVALPVFLAVAAMRFWLSRLDVRERNAAEARHGEHVLEKSPDEMREIVRDRLAVAPSKAG